MGAKGPRVRRLKLLKNRERIRGRQGHHQIIRVAIPGKRHRLQIHPGSKLHRVDLSRQNVGKMFLNGVVTIAHIVNIGIVFIASRQEIGPQTAVQHIFKRKPVDRIVTIRFLFGNHLPQHVRPLQKRPVGKYQDLETIEPLHPQSTGIGGLGKFLNRKGIVGRIDRHGNRGGIPDSGERNIFLGESLAKHQKVRIIQQEIRLLIDSQIVTISNIEKIHVSAIATGQRVVPPGTIQKIHFPGSGNRLIPGQRTRNRLGDVDGPPDRAIGKYDFINPAIRIEIGAK